jgi:hypothetical protein
MKYTAEISSDAMILVQSFMNITSGIQKFGWGANIYRDTDGMVLS